MNLAAVVISGLSLLVLGWLALAQYRLQQRVTRIEEERRREEVTARSRADLTARFERRAGNLDRMDLYLVVHNRGSVEASEVDFQILASGGHGGAELLSKDAFPMPTIDAGGEYTVMALGIPGWMDVKLTWTDPSGAKSKGLRVSVP